MGGLRCGSWILTAVDVLGAPAVLLALVCRLHGLGLKLGAGDVAAGVHGALQGVALPAEHVVAVLTVAGAVAMSVKASIAKDGLYTYWSPMLKTKG
jgi:hypothetical protein